MIDSQALPPEETVVLSRAIVDRINRDFSRLWDYHMMIRRARPLVDGEVLTDSQLAALRQDFQHFTREYGK